MRLLFWLVLSKTGLDAVVTERRLWPLQMDINVDLSTEVIAERDWMKGEESSK